MLFCIYRHPHGNQLNVDEASVDQILYKGYIHTQNYAAIPAKILSTPESVQSQY